MRSGLLSGVFAPVWPRRVDARETSWMTGAGRKRASWPRSEATREQRGTVHEARRGNRLGLSRRAHQGAALPTAGPELRHLDLRGRLRGFGSAPQLAPRTVKVRGMEVGTVLGLVCCGVLGWSMGRGGAGHTPSTLPLTPVWLPKLWMQPEIRLTKPTQACVQALTAVWVRQGQQCPGAKGWAGLGL